MAPIRQKNFIFSDSWPICKEREVPPTSEKLVTSGSLQRSSKILKSGGSIVFKYSISLKILEGQSKQCMGKKKTGPIQVFIIL
jgi:hypothetical protein